MLSVRGELIKRFAVPILSTITDYNTFYKNAWGQFVWYDSEFPKPDQYHFGISPVLKGYEPIKIDDVWYWHDPSIAEIDELDLAYGINGSVKKITEDVAKQHDDWVDEESKKIFKTVDEELEVISEKHFFVGYSIEEIDVEGNNVTVVFNLNDDYKGLLAT